MNVGAQVSSRRGGTISGTIRIFNRKCGTLEYAAPGNQSSTGRIELKARHRVRANCTNTDRFIDEALVFEMKPVKNDPLCATGPFLTICQAAISDGAVLRRPKQKRNPKLKSFSYQFTPPPSPSPRPKIRLSLRDIEDAALNEILQTPGPAMGPWGLFEPLLQEYSSEFRFVEPLGQSREVKTALSGIFGRFVARAYATRHLGYTKFVHIVSPPMQLARPLRGSLRRVPGPGGLGDMPDWVAWGAQKGMAIVEAKGTHDPKGPDATLGRAFAQANRAEICGSGGRLAPFKRYAIATRWGFSAPLNWDPMLWVHDPDEEGDNLPPEEIRELELGIIRLHNANLLERLGHPKLADALRRLVHTFRKGAVNQARAAFNSATAHHVATVFRPALDDALIGGFVTRGGVLPPTDLSAADQQTLSRLQMRPAFVGVERKILMLSIDGDLEAIKIYSERARLRREPLGPQTDGGGGWIVRLDEDSASIE